MDTSDVDRLASWLVMGGTYCVFENSECRAVFSKRIEKFVAAKLRDQM